MPYSASSASATSSRFALPARSPIPLTVPCTQVAPACTAATAAAVASPKSSWPCQWTGTSSQSTAWPTRYAAAFGRRDADRVDDDRLLRARLDRGLVGAAEEVELGARAVDAEERDGDPLAGGERDGLADPVEHRRRARRRAPRACASEIGLSTTAARTPSSASTSTSAWTARAKPQTSACRPASAISRIACGVLLGDAREAGLDPVDARLVERLGDRELVLRRRGRRRPSARRRAGSCRRGRSCRASAARARAG